MTPDEHMNPVEGNTPPGGAAASAPRGAEERAPRLVSRRALVLAGWTVPVVLALHIPLNAFATYTEACSKTWVYVEGVGWVEQETCVGTNG